MVAGFFFALKTILGGRVTGSPRSGLEMVAPGVSLGYRGRVLSLQPAQRA